MGFVPFTRAIYFSKRQPMVGKALLGFCGSSCPAIPVFTEPKLVENQSVQTTSKLVSFRRGNPVTPFRVGFEGKPKGLPLWESPLSLSLFLSRSVADKVKSKLSVLDTAQGPLPAVTHNCPKEVCPFSMATGGGWLAEIKGLVPTNGFDNFNADIHPVGSLTQVWVDRNRNPVFMVAHCLTLGQRGWHNSLWVSQDHETNMGRLFHLLPNCGCLLGDTQMKVQLAWCCQGKPDVFRRPQMLKVSSLVSRFLKTASGWLVKPNR